MRKIIQTIFIFIILLPVLSTIVSAQSHRTQPVSPQENSFVRQTEYYADVAGDSIILPRWGIKSNLLYDAATTFSLGAEFRTGRKTSFDISVSYNPWTFKNNRKWKHIMVQPEFRWWTTQAFEGHFFGLHAYYAFYNVGNLPHGPFSQYMKDHRFEGWLVGGGLSYGYRWNLNHHWAIEATIGVGYAYMSYDKFECGLCGELLASETRHYLGPTKAGVSLIYGIGGASAPEPVYVPEVIPVPVPAPVIYNPEFTVSFITPEVEAVKARNESGSAYLDFVVGRSDIVVDYKNNAAELQKINTLIESVKNDPYATITGITIMGYASPEGREASNRLLSERRANALRNHVGAVHGLPNNLFAIYGAGEDWGGLDSLVNASVMVEKYTLLDIIRGTGDADARERRLKTISGGAPYRYILAGYYPQLRRSDYTITYTVIPFTIEQGKEVMRTRPGSLSLNEMFLIANTYEPGSVSFNKVFVTAAQVFPNSDVANINAAASALGRNDTAAAALYLGKVGEQGGAYWNNMGVLAWLTGDKVAAAKYFFLSGIHGADNGAELDKHLKSLE